MIRQTLAALLFATPVLAQPATLIRDVRVFDGTDVVARTSVLIRGASIAAVGPDLVAPTGATIIDGTGRTLLPGLIDAHTHTFGTALRDALMFGVTTELDMFMDVGLARMLRAEQQAGPVHDRADLFSAGTLVTAPGGHGTQFGIPIPTIASPDSAPAFVRARLAEGSDWIKIVYDDGTAFDLPWKSLDRPTLGALIRATRGADRMAVVHVSRLSAARTAIAEGAHGLVHLFTDSAGDAAFVRSVKAAGAFVVPTLTVLRSTTGKPGAGELLDDTRLAPWLNTQARALLAQSFPASARSVYTHAAATVKTLSDAGVPILAGTDAPNPGTAHGAAMHQELLLLVEAGLTPVQALRAATSVPAHHFGLRDRGRIRAGLRADLLLVDGDPTTDILATRAIDAIWKAGQRVERDAYAAAIAAQVARAADASSSGAISDFESGAPVAAFGTEWMANTDSYAGGSSTGEMSVQRAGTGNHVLRVTGVIDGKLAYAWSGVMWSPGNAPMQAADLSRHAGVTLRIRGTAGTYRILLFAESRGMTPLTHEIEVTDAWREVVAPWSAFGVDGRGTMAIMVVAGPKPGPFTFEVDDVRLH